MGAFALLFNAKENSTRGKTMLVQDPGSPLQKLWHKFRR